MKNEALFYCFFILGRMLYPTYFIISQGKKKIPIELSSK